jgi:hypothetical protein
MSIDIEQDELFPLNRPEAFWPTRPVPDLSQFFRWRTRGLLAPSGARVRLQTVKIGLRRFTTKAAVAEFIAAQNGQPVAVEKPEQKKRRASDAGKVLEAMGV